jgi:transcriptional regulator with XRE-family HTH domain
MKEILNNVRMIREQRNLSQEQVAEMMEMTQSSYARFERGATKTDLETLGSFGKIMGYTLVDLITYPRKYIDIETIDNFFEGNQVVLQIALKKDKKDQVLKLIFGNECLEILNNNN